MNVRQVLIASTALSLLSIPGAQADQEFTYDGGKRASFAAVSERNKAKLAHARSLHTLGRPTDLTEAEGTCTEGMSAGTYPCQDIDMIAHLGVEDFAVLSELTGLPAEESEITFFNDIWGYTHEEARREYALLGASQGLIVVEVTDPSSLQVIGILPSKGYDIFEDNMGEGNFWRDVKVHDGHAFIVSEQQDQGIQVLDLKALADVDTSAGPVALEAVATYDKMSSSHNIFINEDSGFAYAIGTNTCLGGIEMVDVSDPTNPTDAGCYKDHGYIHDIQCVNYEGPDERYHGREICVGSAGEVAGFDSGDAEALARISVIDVTDKANVEPLAFFSYNEVDGLAYYSHQGWFTEDQKYFLHDDELDEEAGTVETTTTRIWDMSDLTNPTLVAATTNGVVSIDHNLYVRGNYSVHSNYTSGLRIFDTSKAADGELPEVAFFDMYPDDNEEPAPSFDGGTWSNYPYFKYQSRNMIAVSSIDRGFFLLQPAFDLDGNVSYAARGE